MDFQFAFAWPFPPAVRATLTHCRPSHVTFSFPLWEIVRFIAPASRRGSRIPWFLAILSLTIICVYLRSESQASSQRLIPPSPILPFGCPAARVFRAVGVLPLLRIASLFSRTHLLIANSARRVPRRPRLSGGGCFAHALAPAFDLTLSHSPIDAARFLLYVFHGPTLTPQISIETALSLRRSIPIQFA
jgi:hypothetical protein